MLNIKINGKDYQVGDGITILEAARQANIDIPTLCYLKEINAIGSCRICVVEVKGARSMVASCVAPVTEGMEITTNSVAVQKARRMTLELILSNHDMECLTCIRNQNCELQKLSMDYGLQQVRFESNDKKLDIENATEYLVRDNNKCILCRRCVAACKNQAVDVIGAVERGFDTKIACAFEKDLNKVPCVACGQCIAVCPTGALYEKDDTDKIWQALGNPDKHVVVGIAPSIRVTLGECFDMPIGTNVEGKTASALKALGFDGVFDIDTAADFTVMEEGTEFIERFTKNQDLPLITSCSPGWVKYCEHFYPEFIKNLSSAKSPQSTFGALMKSYYAEKMNLNPEDIFVVGVMPCTAKKFEVARPELSEDGIPDVDVSITTRELGRMIKRAGINFRDLPDEQFDYAFGIATGAGHIFGATGGVMEAALRTVAEVLEGKDLESLDFKDVRGQEGIKEAEYEIAGKKVKVAVVSGLKNAKTLLDSIKSGKKKYDFIEIMGCPGGCINGGGQPTQPANVRNFTDLKKLRSSALYTQDKGSALRKSHANPIVREVYADFLGHPGSHKSHELLHTKYAKRELYRD